MKKKTNYKGYQEYFAIWNFWLCKSCLTITCWTNGQDDSLLQLSCCPYYFLLKYSLTIAHFSWAVVLIIFYSSIQFEDALVDIKNVFKHALHKERARKKTEIRRLRILLVILKSSHWEDDNLPVTVTFIKDSDWWRRRQRRRWWQLKSRRKWWHWNLLFW